MAYDRYDTRRDRERGRHPEFDRDRERGRHEDRGFFERAGDEVASWFGDEEAERRRREDERMNRGWDRERDHDRDRDATGGWGERDRDRDRFAPRSSRRGWDRGRSGDEERSPRGYAGYEHDFTPRGWGGAFTGSDYERRDFERGDRSRRDFGGTARDYDRNYQAWRQQQLDELDRDYDEYRRENQERFESDFGKWRQTRQQKRGLLGNIREHMDVVGSDGETVGKVDCVKGDRIVLTKEDSEDNRHHSIKCTMIDKVEGDQVRLDIPAEEAKSRFRDEDRGFFGREENENVNLERSFSGTYR